VVVSHLVHLIQQQQWVPAASLAHCRDEAARHGTNIAVGLQDSSSGSSSSRNKQHTSINTRLEQLK
jgi:hypothetical protein